MRERKESDGGGNGKTERKTAVGATEAVRPLNQLMCECVCILPETEIALTPLLTASNFFSLLDTLEEKNEQTKNYKPLTLTYNKTYQG